jgi:succinate dehydrogenase / fumarate reductase flavoprotein subunit
MPSTPKDPTAAYKQRLEDLKKGSSKVHPGPLYHEMQETMMTNVGVYRSADRMQQAVGDVRQLREQFKEIRLQDAGKNFNAEALGVFELENLLDLSLITAGSALDRKESRGAHSREDFTERDDDNYLKHTLANIDESGEVTIEYKTVDTHKWVPKPRTY